MQTSVGHFAVKGRQHLARRRVVSAESDGGAVLEQHLLVGLEQLAVDERARHAQVGDVHARLLALELSVRLGDQLPVRGTLLVEVRRY